MVAPFIDTQRRHRKWALQLGLAVILMFVLKLGVSSAHAMSADEVYALSNQARASQGLGGLSANGALSQAAYNKANDMFRNNYWAHTSPSGVTPWDWLAGVGYSYQSAGENLANGFSTGSAVVNAWMNSPEHRANLLNPNFNETGIAVVPGVLGGQQTILVVAYYGQSNYVAPAPTPNPAPAPANPSPPPAAAPAATQDAGAAADSSSPTDTAPADPTPPDTASQPAAPAPATPESVPVLAAKLGATKTQAPRNWWSWIWLHLGRLLHTM